MPSTDVRTWRTPREQDLGLLHAVNQVGVDISVASNGSVFAIEHRTDTAAILINQVLASPIGGGIARIVLRSKAQGSTTRELLGSQARVRLGSTTDTIVWEGATPAIRHRVTLRLLPDKTAWLWCVEVTNTASGPVAVDAIFVQDLGLGARGFVTGNEAYASQYIDHHVAKHPRYGPVLMSRQNLAQDGAHPWVVHGCLDGADGFVTDAMQLFGPSYRDADRIALPFGARLASRRLQHEVACTGIQSLPVTVQPGAGNAWRFFALYEPDHPDASHDGDVKKLDGIAWPEIGAIGVATARARRSIAQDSRTARVVRFDDVALARRYPDRYLEEFRRGRLLSFFTPDPPHNRHVVLQSKERAVTRRHGALLRSGNAMLPDESTLCATCWMHGVFGAQLTIGNTSFHKLFSVSRDPYNITRTSGLRALIDTGDGRWRLLAIPSGFEMGLSDCRWIYVLPAHVITVHAIASGDDPAMQWRISAEGGPCRFLIFGHLVLGERELEHAGIVGVDSVRRRFTFRPDPDSLWGQRYPSAVYHLVTSTPDAVDTLGGDALLFADGLPGSGAHVAIRTAPTREFRFAVVGSLLDSGEAEVLAQKYEQAHEDAELMASATKFWTGVTRAARIAGDAADIRALNASLPWLAHDAMIHLTVPRGLEQYTAAAWGTRDVCQGPVEFLLALEHDGPVKEILRIVFAQQYATRGDWPQWFMLEPYSSIQDTHSHGDVVVWPLKALNDYLEASNDLGFLDERVSWRNDQTFERTARQDPIADHVDKLLATVRGQFIPGTHLPRYGEGDWNDSLQPADPALRNTMVSSWTVALLYQQLVRYAGALHRAHRNDAATALADLARDVRQDFNRLLIRDGTVAGYALFEPGRAEPEMLLHPSDARTGLRYSLLPMTRSIIAGLFTPEQTQHHLRLIREHLLFPDGARLIDRPVAYHGGIEQTFRRAESAAFFGREIGLMYVHAHLRYAKAMAVLGEADALWEALQVVNPVGVTEHVANAALRQRNAYFSSSDAAFPDRYEASASWPRVRAGTIAVEGGWRVYSSGPGLYVDMLIRHALGDRRFFGDRIETPVLPAAFVASKLAWNAPVAGDPPAAANVTPMR
jgi:cellobiose phosphorylase